MKQPKHPKRTRNIEFENRVRSLDKLQRYEEFASQILPALQEDLIAGLSTEDILKKYGRFAAARAITVALIEEDGGKAMAAAKSIIEHEVGKAIEKKEIRHQFEDLADEEIDAALKSKLKLINGDD